MKSIALAILASCSAPSALSTAPQCPACPVVVVPPSDAATPSDAVIVVIPVDADPPVVVVPPVPAATVVEVVLAPRVGVSGIQRVNFAVPLARGLLSDPSRIRVTSGGLEISAGRRALARYSDGTLRSIQVQVQTAATALQVHVDQAPGTSTLALVAVSTTIEIDGGPRVWARLPAAWLSSSGVVGPMIAEAQTSPSLRAFDKVCDYENHTVTHFLTARASKDVWLYDRATVMYRGHARRGDQLTLESAYREAAIYRDGLTGVGAATRIGVPGSAEDLKYHYTQGLAIHYLMTGDDRFRESAEGVATRVASLWQSPGYAGGEDFWTERHAGFGLLAYVHARIVTDDQAPKFTQLAADAVKAYLAVQSTYPAGWTDAAARCFAHQAIAHGEDYDTWGCSPWMSAIIAEALDIYATETGDAAAKTAIVKLGKILARDGIDPTGKPFYWMGVGAATDEIDDFEEHWGEPAYVIAMAWHHGGRTDAALKTAALALLGGLKAKGVSPHLRSFNWQCRAAVAAPFYLQ